MAHTVFYWCDNCLLDPEFLSLSLSLSLRTLLASKESRRSVPSWSALLSSADMLHHSYYFMEPLTRLIRRNPRLREIAVNVFYILASIAG